MLPISASLSASDTTTQSTGPTGQASAPIFSVVHQIGDGNTSNPKLTAEATATPSNPYGTASSDLPSWLVPVALGLAIAAVLGIALQKKR